jgi:mannobiose 2-epimerase
MKSKIIKTMQILLVNFMMFIILAGNYSIKDKDQKLFKELENSMRNELLDAWYTASLDTVYGGFLNDFTYDWQPAWPQNKMLVIQTRHLWTASQAAMFYNDDRYRKIARHAFLFLKDKMPDKTCGGFYMLLNREGQLTGGSFGNNKLIYGNAFTKQ